MSAARYKRTLQVPFNADSHTYFLGLGSNIEPRLNLPRALDLLRQVLVVEAVSSAWETPAVGTMGPDFLNAAILARSNLDPGQLKIQIIRPVESSLGRVRTSNKNAPRTIDIDVLIFDGEIIEPLVWKEAYLAEPLAEIIPQLRNKESGETLDQVARRLAKSTKIQSCPGILSPA